MKKLEIQVIITKIMFIRSSERIFNPSRYIGIIRGSAHTYEHTEVSLCIVCIIHWDTHTHEHT